VANVRIFNMINIACIIALVIYLHNYYRKNENKKPLSRLNFMLCLHDKLVEEKPRRRLEISTLRTSLRVSIKESLGIPEPGPLTSESEAGANVFLEKRKYCTSCSYEKRRHTTTGCNVCKTPICGEHQLKVCSKCSIKLKL